MVDKVDTVGARYGFMRDVEADLIDSLLHTIKHKFGIIKLCEIGVFAGGTSRGVYRRAKEIECPVRCVGVDFEQYRPNPTPDPNYIFYAGDSADMWREFPADYQCNFLFIDGCHCSNHAIMDFCNYSPFVENCGYVLFHDTALPIGKEYQEEWPQDHSYAGKPSSFLGVREALKKLGLLDAQRGDFKLIEELESSSGLMGMMLYQRTKSY